MKERQLTENSTLFGKFAVTLSLILVGGAAFSRIVKQVDYSESESKSKLERIGRALMLYRQEYCVAEESSWETPSDAGLPPVLTVLAEKGHNWSLPDGMASFRLEGRRMSRLEGDAIDFLHLYTLPGIKGAEGTWIEKIPAYLSKRGVNFPVLSDPHLAMDPKFDHKEFAETLILRANGRVEKVSYRQNDKLDIYTR